MKAASLLPFLFFTVCAATSFAQTEKPATIENLALPESLGKIEERFVGKNSRWIIHIQDVHAHLTAQDNIATIADHLNSVYGIKIIATEGSWSATSYPKTWGLPSSREKQAFAKALLEKDILSGPAYAALFAQMPITLIGIEDPEAYEQNRQIYLKHLTQRKELDAKIKAYEESLAEEKKQAYNSALWNFDVLVTQFHEGQKAEKLIPSLLNWAQEKQILLSDLNQISIFNQWTAVAGSIKGAKLESEKQRLLADYKRERLSFEELLKSGKIPADKLQYYPEILKYHQMLSLQAQISHRKFFAEIEEAIKRLKEKLFAAEEEKTLDKKWERFLLAKKIMLLKATPDDLKVYDSIQNELVSELSTAGFSDPIGLALSFYDMAKKRDAVFFQKITSDPRLAGNIMVVTGGFHTEGLDKQLEQAGISYLLITPNLGDEAPDEELYVKRLRENILKTQTLSDKQNRENDAQDAQIAEIITKLTRKEIGDIRKAVEMLEKSVPPSAEQPPQETQPSAGENFLTKPAEEQRTLLNRFLEMQKGSTRVAVLLKASTLADLLFPKSPEDSEVRKAQVALTSLGALLNNRGNTLYILNDDPVSYSKVLGETGGSADVKHVTGDNFDSVIAKINASKRIHAIGVIDSRYRGSENVLVLKPYPAALFLIRPLLELKEYRQAMSSSEVLSALQDILFQVFRDESILRAA